MTLHIFNPEHDMALAAGTPYYTPPAAIRRMAEQMAWLPSLWAEPVDLVVGKDVMWNELSKTLETLETQKLKNSKTQKLKNLTHIEPWGWDSHLCHRLLQAGVAPTLLPTDHYLTTIRQLSSRRTAVQALATMHGDGLCGESYWCESADDARAIAESMPHAMLKSPWSSSGKGLLTTHGNLTDAACGWLRNIIARQGGVAVERLCDKAVDCALEYVIEAQNTSPLHNHRNASARYLGLSVFTTSATGAYLGNLLGSEEHKMSRAGIDSTMLQRLVELHLQFIEEHIAPHYTGLLGIDIMVCRDGRINPCIEINLRRTMGHVALLSPSLRTQSSGVFSLRGIRNLE